MPTTSPETTTHSDESGPANFADKKLTPNEYIRELERENFDLVAKCIELINVVGWSDDDTYTFTDGDRWAKFDPDPKLARHHFRPEET
jgi:hypothetical protein